MFSCLSFKQTCVIQIWINSWVMIYHQPWSMQDPLLFYLVHSFIHSTNNKYLWTQHPGQELEHWWFFTCYVFIPPHSVLLSIAPIQVIYHTAFCTFFLLFWDVINMLTRLTVMVIPFCKRNGFYYEQQVVKHFFFILSCLFPFKKKSLMLYMTPEIFLSFSNRYASSMFYIVVIH